MKKAFKVGEEVEYVRHDKDKFFVKGDKKFFTIGKKYTVSYVFWDGGVMLAKKNRRLWNYQIRHLPKKPKKKPYWVEVENTSLYLKGHNGFEMQTISYFSVREANQMARNLAKRLEIEFRQ